MPFVSPMLANAVNIEDIPRKCPGYFMEPKLDGVRCIVVKQGDDVSLYSRTEHSLGAKLPWLCSDFIRAFPNTEFVLDGELGYWEIDRYGICMDFNKTMRVVGSSTAEAIRKQHDVMSDTGQAMCFMAFDILELNGVSLISEPQGARRAKLASLISRANKTYTIDYTATMESWNEEYYTTVVELGGEGVILKNPDATYAPGKRTAKRWYKVKKFHTTDVFISGYDPGKGKYEGQIGALWLSVYDKGAAVLVGKCSGFDDSLRQVMSNDFETYRNRVVEVKFFGRVGAYQSGLRHPQFVRMRQDKLAAECTMESLENT